MVLTKVIYLDTRTRLRLRLRISVMFMGQYDYHSQIYNHFNHVETSSKQTGL